MPASPGCTGPTALHPLQETLFSCETVAMPSEAKSLLRALSGEAVWPPPTWLMRQAGRYLPEYRATKEKAGGFFELCLDPASCAEVTFQPLRRFGFDAAILFTDLPMLPWAMGRNLRYEAGGGPMLDPVQDRATVESLFAPDRMLERAEPIFETVRLVRAGLARDHRGTALIGFAGAPWTVACYMVDGRGGHEFPVARRMAYADPALFGLLVDRVVDAAASYLLAQAAAGAEALMLFDSWAGLLSPAGFDRWVIGPTAELVRRLRETLGPDYPLIGFPRLCGPLLPHYVERTGLRAVAMDTAMDPRWAAAHVPQEVTLQGNLDPLALVAGGAGLAAETRAILAAVRGRPFIFNVGHGIVPQTPPDHVGELMRLLRSGEA